MSYFEEIKSIFKEHIDLVKMIPLQDLNKTSQKKIESHLKSSSDINESVDREEPEKLKKFIDYLENEGRFFGWSFPENEKEEICENSFWNLKSRMQSLIEGMTGNERLFYFGYLDEFESITSTQKSAKDAILRKLFM